MERFDETNHWRFDTTFDQSEYAENIPRLFTRVAKVGGGLKIGSLDSAD